MKGTLVTVSSVWDKCRVLPSEYFPKNLYYSLVKRNMMYGIVQLNKKGANNLMREVKWYDTNHKFIAAFWSNLNSHLTHIDEGYWDIDIMMDQLDNIAEKL